MEHFLELLLTNQKIKNNINTINPEIDTELEKLYLIYGKWAYNKYIWDCGSWYHGQSIIDKKDSPEYREMAHGRGIYRIKDETTHKDSWFLGYFNKGTFKYGLYIYDDGECYIGNWKNDIRNGIGIYINKIGERVIGNWVDGELDGWSVTLYKKAHNSHKGYVSYYHEGDIKMYGGLVY